MLAVLAAGGAGVARAEAPPEAEITRVLSLKAIQKQRWFEAGGDWFRLLAVVDTGSLPKGVTVTADGKHVIVTNFGHHDGRNVYRYDPATLEITAKAKFPGNAVEVLPSVDGKLVYVSNFYHQQLLGLDPATLEIKRAYQTGKVPKHFALSPDGRRAYVANWESESISVVDLISNQLVKNVKTDYQPRGVAITQNGKKIYVANTGAHTWSVIDAATLTATTRKSCRFPRHAGTTPAGLIIISCLGTHLLHVIDPATDEVVRKVSVGHGPKTIDFTRDGRFAFTADYRGDTMSIVDLASWKSWVVPLPVTRGSGVAVSPDGRRIYVTGWDSDNMAVFEHLLPGDAPGPLPRFSAEGIADLGKLVRPPQREPKPYEVRRAEAKARSAKRRKAAREADRQATGHR